MRLLRGLLALLLLACAPSGIAARCPYPERCDHDREYLWDSSGFNGYGGCSPNVLSVAAGKAIYSYVCTDADTATLEVWRALPLDWDGGFVRFSVFLVQTAADTGALHSDVAVQCRAAGEMLDTTYEPEQPMDLSSTVGSGALDLVSSASFLTTCEAGDFLYVQWQVDAAGTTAAMATLHIVQLRLELD